jgi:poly(A) polymerase
VEKQTIDILQQSARFFAQQGQQAYLVGGSLRNLLLGTAGSDWDIVSGGDAPALARRLADVLHGHFAYLHARASRVVVPLPAPARAAGEVVLDIAPIKRTLEEDLRARDFTINALAAPLEQVIRHLQTGEALHPFDPLQGLADIEARRLSAVDGDIFRHDPLRMLRAPRLRARYRLSIDAWTRDLIARDAPLLPQAAPARIRDELYALLQPGGAIAQLRWLDAHGLLTTLIPECIPARGMPQPPPHLWDVLEHSLRAVDALELLATLLQRPPQELGASPLNGAGPGEDLLEIAHLLREAGEQQVGLSTPPIKLAALLHDIGKPESFALDAAGHIHFFEHTRSGAQAARQIMRRLGASVKDQRLVQQVAAHHLRPGQLARPGALTPRTARRYFLDLGPTGITVALFSLADHLATRVTTDQAGLQAWEQHVAAVCLLLTRYIRQRESILPPRLLSAAELMRSFDLRPGPRVGLLLELIAQAQADGSVRSREEALRLVEERLEHPLEHS